MAKDVQKDQKTLTGTEKAAVVLMALGQELAAEVCKHLTQAEMQMLGSAIVKKDAVPVATSKQVVSEFLDSVSGGNMVVAGLEFTKNLLTKSLGADKAKPIIEHITREMQGGGIEAIKWMDPAVIANMIKTEHPQIIALILVHLDPERAAQVVMNIQDETIRGEVVLRIATLKAVPEAAVRDLEVLLHDQIAFAGGSGGGSTSIEGIKLAAEIMNQIEGKSDNGILDMIEKISPDLAQRIQEKMFVFADLLSIDDRGLQQIIKEVNTDILCVALKGAEDALKEKFFKNMSERAAEMLKEEMEIKGPMRLSDVEKAQQEIIKAARRLEQEGKIVRGKSGDVLV